MIRFICEWCVVLIGGTLLTIVLSTESAQMTLVGILIVSIIGGLLVILEALYLDWKEKRASRR